MSFWDSDGGVRFTAIVGVALGLHQWWLTASASHRRARGERFAHTHRLILGGEFQAEFDHRMDRRERTLAGWLLAGAALMLVVPIEQPAEAPLAVLVPISVVITGNALSLAMEFARQFRPGIPTRARLRAVAMSDYVSPLVTLALVIAASAVSVVIGLVAIAVRAHRIPVRLGVTSIGIGCLLLCALAASVLIARHISALPEPALTEADLYLQDALRAETISAVCTSGFAGAFIYCSQVTIVHGVIPGGYLGAAVFANAAFIAGVCGILIFVCMPSRLNRYFTRRLWPELADAPAPRVVVA